MSGTNVQFSVSQQEGYLRVFEVTTKNNSLCVSHHDEEKSPRLFIVERGSEYKSPSSWLAASESASACRGARGRECGREWRKIPWYSTELKHFRST